MSGTVLARHVTQTGRAEPNTNDSPGLRDSPSVTVQRESEPPISTVSLTPAEPQRSAQPHNGHVPPARQPEEPSPLEGDTFMSFEEWKKQNLRKAGQSDHVGRDKTTMQAKREYPVNIHNALDSLGDDAEIDLIFPGFIPGGPELTQPAPSETGHQKNQPETGSNRVIASRSKDAGTTCKARYNYASFDCAATVRQTNPEASNLNAILGENKDNYMLNVCGASNKFLILELCDDISIDTIVLANFEFFSSIFRTFRVSVSDKYPVKADKWKEIGLFEARNTRDVQAFLVDNPTIWAKYLKIEFLTHYGNEYYCPVSLVRVHGTTMMEEYKRDADNLLAGDDEDLEIEVLTATVEETTVRAESTPPSVEDHLETLSLTTEQNHASSSSSRADKTSNNQLPASSETDGLIQPDATPSSVCSEPDTCVNIQVNTAVFLLISPADTCAAHTGPPVKAGMVSDTSHALPTSSQSATATVAPVPSNEQINSTNTVEAIHNSVVAMKHASHQPEHASKPAVNSNAKYNSDATQSDRQKASQPTQAHGATPTMQDSFFKSVHKRLQMLEANSSLSLQYIEDQSRALRHAFNKVEERQLARATTFFDYLNTTVLNELRSFRVQYNQLWQSTVIELEVQRERYQQENAEVNARLGVLADELIFQKRILILQMVLIVICLALVLFARGSLNQYLEMPVVQKVLASSSSHRWRLGVANPESPTPVSPTSPRNSSGKGQGILKQHKRMQSQDSVEDSLSPGDIYPSPLTPSSPSYGDQSGPEGTTRDESRREALDFDPITIPRPSTSPPILPSKMPSLPDLDLIGLKDNETIDSRIEAALSDTPSRHETVHNALAVPQLAVEDGHGQTGPSASEPEQKRKTAIVTGAARGIGKSIALRLAHDGYDLCVNDVPSQKGDLDSVITEIQSTYNRKAIAFPADVSDLKQVEAMVEESVKSLGPLNLMVANAGIAQVKGLLDLTEEDFRHMFEVNVYGVYNCYRAAAQKMIEQGHGGKILGCASIVAFKAFAMLGHYSASKWAVRGLTQAMAMEMAKHNITVNAYAPGIVGTKMWDLIDEGLGKESGAKKGEVMEKYTRELTALGRTSVPEDVSKVVEVSQDELNPHHWRLPSSYTASSKGDRRTVIPDPSIFRNALISNPGSPSGAGPDGRPIYPDISHAAVHLALLECFRNLRHRATELGIKSRGPELPRYDFNEKRPHPTSTMEEEAESEQWTMLIRLAITRFQTWWTHLDRVFKHAAAYSHHGGHLGVVQLSKDYMPPLDVLLVWYAFMLEPEEYQRACIECQMPRLAELCFPWPVVRDLIDFDTMTLTITRPAEKLFKNLTQQSADILEYVQAPPAYAEPSELSSTIDLFALVKKQDSFLDLAHNLLWIRSPSLVSSLKRSCDAYLAAQSTNDLFFMSPRAIPFGIDLMWRTHRLYPAQYSDFRNAISSDTLPPSQFLGTGPGLEKSTQGEKAPPSVPAPRPAWTTCLCWTCERIRQDLPTFAIPPKELPGPALANSETKRRGPVIDGLEG
ncbi:hypothetical protein DV738_g1018, partial [Chaetothyriales sp. CBS 135597]